MNSFLDFVQLGHGVEHEGSAEGADVFPGGGEEGFAPVGDSAEDLEGGGGFEEDKLLDELPAATIAAGTMGASVKETITDPQVFSAIAWTMTLGIISGIVLVLFGLKRIRRGMRSITGKDKRWGEIVMDSLFLGMVSAFVGMLFADIRSGLPGFIPIAVALVSALMMGICGVLIKVCKMSWLEQYALPLCMLCAMALSIPLTALMA